MLEEKKIKPPKSPKPLIMAPTPIAVIEQIAPDTQAFMVSTQNISGPNHVEFVTNVCLEGTKGNLTLDLRSAWCQKIGMVLKLEDNWLRISCRDLKEDTLVPFSNIRFLRCGK